MTSVVKCVYSTLQTQLLVAGTACGNKGYLYVTPFLVCEEGCCGKY